MELLDAYSTAQLLAGLGAAFGAAVVRGLAGFGMAILLMPVLALALDPVHAVLVANALGVMIGLVELRHLIGHSERSAWIIGGFIMLSTPAGLWLLEATDPALARLVIAMIALLAFAAIFLPRRSSTAPGMFATAGVGTVAGLLTGFAGMPGPPVVPYYVGRELPREVVKASMLLVFTIASVSGSLAGIALGHFDLSIAWLAIVLFPAILLGNWLGEKASDAIGDATWRFLVAVILGGTAISALARLS